ncbi:MAG: TIGR00730 family Rossman fold protein [Anaerolineales bacterium]
MQSVCVYCGSADGVRKEYLEAAYRLGALLAKRGIRLIYGGGRTGLMGALANGALGAGGEVIGVIVPSMNTPALAHPALSAMEVMPDMHARKARMHELADGYIALPGGFGTFDELFETITWAQIGHHQKPIGLLNVLGYFDRLLAALDYAVKEKFIFQEHRAALHAHEEPEVLLRLMENHRPPLDAIRRWMRETG